MFPRLILNLHQQMVRIRNKTWARSCTSRITCPRQHAVIGPILRYGPIRRRLSAWCAVVRSRLEYGAEVVTLNVELTKSLEGVQHLGVTTLRINRHASKQAANGIIGLPSISARFHQKRLAYLGPQRWPRRVYDLDPTFKVKLNGPRMPVAHRVPEAGQ